MEADRGESLVAPLSASSSTTSDPSVNDGGHYLEFLLNSVREDVSDALHVSETILQIQQGYQYAREQLFMVGNQTLIRARRYSIWMFRAFIKILLIMLRLFVMFSIAIFTYIRIRDILLPELTASLPVYFQFPSPRVLDLANEMRPYAQVDLSDPDLETYRMANTQFGKGATIDARVSLTMPYTDANVEVGMFMITLRIVDSSGAITSNSSRPTMLRVQSNLIRTMSTIFFSLPLVLGIMSEDQSISVSMNKIPWPEKNLLLAYLELSDPRLQVYESSLHLIVTPVGFRLMMSRYPILCAIVGIGAIMVLESTLYLYLVFVRGRRRRRGSDDDDEDGGSNDDDDDDDDGMQQYRYPAVYRENMEIPNENNFKELDEDFIEDFIEDSNEGMVTPDHWSLDDRVFPEEEEEEEEPKAIEVQIAESDEEDDEKKKKYRTDIELEASDSDEETKESKSELRHRSRRREWV